MNNLIIAALTTGMLTATMTTANAENNKCIYEKQKEMLVERVDFQSFNDKFEPQTSSKSISVDVDYILQENGAAYITYINSDDDDAKEEVVKFIEHSTYSTKPIPGKIYSLKFQFTK
ncbi:MAG: hypothetical protein R2739_09875 [Chitinophagales bacterium]